jgi:hypothetical protein
MGESIPRSDAGFNLRQNIISETVAVYKTQWLIDDVWFDNVFTPKKEAWDTAWETYGNPETRTPVYTFNKTEARKAFEPLLRQMVQILQSSPRVSNIDLVSMGIVPPSHARNPAPVASSYPAARPDTSILRVVRIFFHDIAGTRKAKPKGQHGAEIRWMLLDALPESVNELAHSAFDTNSPHTLVFDDKDRGRTIYFCMRWENTRGEKGPWSAINSVIIP